MVVDQAHRAEQLSLRERGQLLLHAADRVSAADGGGALLEDVEGLPERVLLEEDAAVLLALDLADLRQRHGLGEAERAEERHPLQQIDAGGDRQIDADLVHCASPERVRVERRGIQRPWSILHPAHFC